MGRFNWIWRTLQTLSVIMGAVWTCPAFVPPPVLV